MIRKCKCRHCREILVDVDSSNMEWQQWLHLKVEHPEEFKKQEDKEIRQLFRDNFVNC